MQKAPDSCESGAFIWCRRDESNTRPSHYELRHKLLPTVANCCLHSRQRYFNSLQSCGFLPKFPSNCDIAVTRRVAPNTHQCALMAALLAWANFGNDSHNCGIPYEATHGWQTQKSTQELQRTITSSVGLGVPPLQPRLPCGLFGVDASPLGRSRPEAVRWRNATVGMPSGHTHVVVRCPACGISRRNRGCLDQPDWREQTQGVVSRPRTFRHPATAVWNQ